MEISFQAHHAVISDRMRTRAERAVRRIAERVHRPVNAVIRFEEDGRTRRVEIVLNAPPQRRLVAEATARFFGNALTLAAQRLLACVARERRRVKPARRATPRLAARA